MDRMENIVTEKADEQEGERKIRSALNDCGYPKWRWTEWNSIWKINKNVPKQQRNPMGLNAEAWSLSPTWKE